MKTLRSRNKISHTVGSCKQKATVLLRMFGALLLLLLLCAMLAACNKDTDTLAFQSFGDGTCKVTGIGTCTDTDIVIPTTSPKGDKVISIGENAFKGCSHITSITIPEGIEKIDCAFEGCTGLTSITLPFVGTSPNDTQNTHFGYIFGANSYSDNNDYVPTTLKTVAITGGTSIGHSAFKDCNSISSISIPLSVTSIGSSAFYGCSGLTSISIPASVTTIGNCAFEGCSGLTSIKLPFVGAALSGTNNTHFGYIFGASSHSYNDDYVPTALKTVVITGGTSIGYDAFYNCSGLTSISIPTSVTFIANEAFEGCNGLTSITLPFVGASLNDTTDTHFGHVFGASSFFSNRMFVPTSLKTVVITGGTSIDSDAFSNCANLTSITLPASVTSIGSSAFFYCSGLTTVTFAENSQLISISSSAFEGCNKLTSINIPASVTTIGSSAFEGCNKIIQKENGVSYVDKWVIGCDADVTSVTFHSNTAGICSFAFSGCSELTSITIPASVTSIGNYTFYGCSELTSISIPTSVTFIGDFAFRDCSKLTSINIPASVTTIGSSAFYNCSKLTSITLPTSVTYIGDFAFYNCSGLKSVMFETTSGWWVTTSSTATSGTSISATNLSNTATAATYLTSTYCTCYWKRS